MTGWNDASPLGPLGVADPDQADPQDQRQQHELRQVVLGERLANAPRYQLHQQVGHALFGQRLDHRARLGKRGPMPG